MPANGRNRSFNTACKARATLAALESIALAHESLMKIDDPCVSVCSVVNSENQPRNSRIKSDFSDSLRNGYGAINAVFAAE